MAKVTQKGRSKGGAKHVRLYLWLMKTAAWQSLNPISKTLLVELYSLFNGDNNGELFLSEREAAKRCKISKPTARKYLKELEEKGFIKAKIKGSFNMKSPEATSWVLTEFPYNNQTPTKNFMTWQPPKN